MQLTFSAATKTEFQPVLHFKVPSRLHITVIYGLTEPSDQVRNCQAVFFNWKYFL